MRILIDGDNCSKLSLIEQVAKDFDVKVIVFCDYSREIESEYCEVRYNDIGANSTDNAIFNECQKDDLIITNDIGLASLCLLKCDSVLNNYGRVFTNQNISKTLNITKDNNRRRYKTNKRVKVNYKNNHPSFGVSLNKEIKRRLKK